MCVLHGWKTCSVFILTKTDLADWIHWTDIRKLCCIFMDQLKWILKRWYCIEQKPVLLNYYKWTSWLLSDNRQCCYRLKHFWMIEQVSEWDFMQHLLYHLEGQEYHWLWKHLQLHTAHMHAYIHCQRINWFVSCAIFFFCPLLDPFNLWII